MTNREIDALVALKGKCAYNEANKAEFKRLSMKLLRALSKELKLQRSEFTLHYNPGGIAVSGDASLHTDKLHIFFNMDICDWIVGRTCNGRTDYSGGPNQCYTFAQLQRDGLAGLVSWAGRILREEPKRIFQVGGRPLSASQV